MSQTSAPAAVTQCRTVGDHTVDLFVEKLGQTFGESLLCVYFFGSRALGEARSASDYDLIIILDVLTEQKLAALNRLLREFPLIQPFCWGKSQLKGLPQHHVYWGAKLVYGAPLLVEPSAEALKIAFREIARNLMNTVTHYLILPHENDHVATRIYDKLKQLYFLLSIQFRWSEGHFPGNRAAVLAFLRRERDWEGVHLLTLLTTWDELTRQQELAVNPRPVLFRLLKYVEGLLTLVLQPHKKNDSRVPNPADVAE